MLIEAKAPAKKSILDQVHRFTLVAENDQERAILAVAHMRLVSGKLWTPDLIEEAKQNLASR